MVNLGDSDASVQEKNWCSKNLSEEKKGKEKNCDSMGKQQNQGPSSNVLASSFEKDKFSGSDEGIEISKRKELCLNGSAVENFLKSCANQEKAMPLVKKSKSLSKVSFCDDNLVRFDKGDAPKLHISSNAESFQSAAVNPNVSFNGLSLDSNGNLIKFSSIGKAEMNQLEKSSKLRSSFSGLPVNNSLHHSRQQSLSIGERSFAPNTLQDSCIQQNNQDKIPRKESSSLISPCCSQPRTSLKQMRGDFRFLEETRRHYSEGAAKPKSLTGSKLQISAENLYQPVKLDSSKTFANNMLMQSNSMFQSRSIGGVSRNLSPSISDQLRARTIPQGLVSNPAFNNGETNERKRHHNVTSSAFELSHLPPQPPLSWISPSTHERLPGITSRNVNLCPPAPIVQPAHGPVINQPSPITTVKATTNDNHQFSISRKRPASDFIDLTVPSKLPNVDGQESSRHRTKTNKNMVRIIIFFLSWNFVLLYSHNSMSFPTLLYDLFFHNFLLTIILKKLFIFCRIQRRMIEIYLDLIFLSKNT
ncbi:hypothetical protein QL285_061153 [Trifolium repens]|nr:hypothetical protein QL285_061153 [Trifolium repens]